MVKRNYTDIIVAVEVGTSNVVAAVGELKGDGSLTLIGVGEAPSSGIRKGEVVDFQLAQQSISHALMDAERKTEIDINEVYLVLSGSHIDSRTVMVRVNVDNDEHLITREHVEELDELAHNQPIPSDHAIVHELLQYYQLDNGVKCGDPVGLSSHSLQASYHLVHGLQTRLETTVRCILELDVEIKGYALSSYATAQSIVSHDQKNLGAVVIDLGAGVTDYVTYINGSVVDTGTLAVGGDHLTQDIAVGLKLPYSRAEQLKVNHGFLNYNSVSDDEKIELSRETNFEERSIYLKSLSQIMYLRQREILELIREDLENKGLWPQVAGNVFLTGGASKVKDLLELGAEVFPVPCRLAHEFSFEGDQTYSKRPDLSTVLGLMRYAQNMEIRVTRPRGWAKVRESVKELFASMRLF